MTSTTVAGLSAGNIQRIVAFLQHGPRKIGEVSDNLGLPQFHVDALLRRIPGVAHDAATGLWRCLGADFKTKPAISTGGIDPLANPAAESNLPKETFAPHAVDINGGSTAEHWDMLAGPEGDNFFLDAAKRIEADAGASAVDLLVAKVCRRLVSVSDAQADMQKALDSIEILPPTKRIGDLHLIILANDPTSAGGIRVDSPLPPASQDSLPVASPPPASVIAGGGVGHV